MNMKFGRILLAALVLLAGSFAKADVETVPSVDLDRYLGQWYEIAAIPQIFQKQCAGQVTAEYAKADDSLIKVVNSCRKADGSLSSVEGRARVEDAQTRAKLKVTFVKVVDWVFMLGGDYWVIDLAPDYHYAVVGHPSRDYGWILSRTSSLDVNELKEIRARLVLQGYDPCKLLTTIQTGGFSERRPLCEI